MNQMEAPDRAREDLRSATAEGRLLTKSREAPPVARRQARRIGSGLLSFLLFVTLPTSLAGIWLFGFASDQYLSEFRYVVRRVVPGASSQPNAATAMQGILPQLAMLADSEMLVQYTESRAALEDVDRRVPLQPIYGPAQADFWSRLGEDLPVEDRLRHWRRFVTSSLDLNSSVVTVRVLAFRPEDAQRVADALLSSSEELVNEISRRAQEDAVSLANREVQTYERELAEARRVLGEFRNRNEILTPQMLGNVQAEVLGRLRQSLAEARANLAITLDGGVLSNSPQARIARIRIQALEAELETERRQLGTLVERSGQRESIASVLTTYAELEGNERIALQNLERALAMQSRARLEATARGVYLTTFIKPMMADRSTHPRRYWFVFQVALVAAAAWAILALMWLTIRDQRH